MRRPKTSRPVSPSNRTPRSPHLLNAKPRRRPLSSSLSRHYQAIAMCAGFALAGGPIASLARTLIWDDEAGDFAWPNPVNWKDQATNADPLTPPSDNVATADDLIFAGVAPSFVFMTDQNTGDPVNRAARTLRFETDGYTLGIDGADVLRLTNNSVGNVTVLPGATANLFASLATQAGVTLQFSGGGTPGVTPGGTLVLDASNNVLNGTTTIAAGRLVANNATAIGNATAVNNGGILEIGGSVTLNRSVTLNNGSTLQAGDTASSNGVITVASGANVSLGAGTVGLAIGDSSNDLTGGGGGAVINVIGSGVVTLNNANNVTANWVVKSGTLRLDDPASLGTTSNVATINTGGTVRTTFGTAQNFNYSVVLNGGTFLHDANSQLNFAAGKTFTANAGTTSAISVATSGGSIVLSAGQITGSGNLIKQGSDPLRLQGANAGFSGAWTVENGLLEAATGSLGSNPNAPLTLNGGGAFFVPNYATVTNPIVVNGGGTLAGENNALTYSGTITANGPFSVSLNDFANQAIARDMTFSNTLSGAGKMTVLTPTSARTLTLGSGVGGYDGAIEIQSGVTVVANQAVNGNYGGDISGAGLFIKQGAGKLTFTGNQTGGGKISINNGTVEFATGTATATVIPNFRGTLSVTAPLSVTNLSYSTGGQTAVALGAPSLTPAITVTSALATAASTFNFSNAGGLAAGTYRLLDYSGTALTNQQIAALGIGTKPAGFVYGLVNNTANTSVDLVVENIGATNTFTGAVGSDVGVAGNWTNGANLTGQQLVLNDTAVRRTLTGAAISPQAITVTNVAGNDFSIANNLTGTVAGGVTKNGAGTLQLTGANAFTGGIAVNGGTLRASVSSSASSLGYSAITLGNSSTLQLDPVASTATVGLTGRTFVGASTGNVVTSRDFTLAATDTRTFFTSGSLDTPDNVAYYTGGPVDNFATQWTGKISVANTGGYSFFTSSDDGSRVFIDGQLVTQLDGGHGVTEVAGNIALTAGLHDLRIDYTEGTGGNDMQLRWQGPGVAKALVPATSLFAAESVVGTPANTTTTGTSNAVSLGNSLTVNGSSTVNLNGGQFTEVRVGGLTLNASANLSVTGAAGKLLRADGTALGSAPIAINATADVALGTITDGGVTTTLTKQGTGRLIFDQTNPAALPSTTLATTTIDVQAGKIVLLGANTGSNPLGAAKVQLSGGGLVLDSKGGAVTFDNAVTAAASGTIEVVTGGGVVTTLGGTNSVTVNAGATLTLDVFGGGRSGSAANSAVTATGANLVIPSQIVGLTTTGNLNIQSSQFNLPQFSVGGTVTAIAANNFAGAINVNGPAYLGLASFASPLTFVLSGNGAFTAGPLNPASLTLTNSRLTLDNSVTNLASRISSSHATTLNSGNFNLIANAAVTSGEGIGGLVFNSGQNAITLNGTAAAGTHIFSATTATRNNRSTVQFQGNSLGTQIGGSFNNTTQARFTTTAPAVVGGGGAIGTQTISIVPYAVGAAQTTGTIQWSLVTNDGNNGAAGIRPLTTSEYATFAAAGTTANARDALASGTLSITGKTVNSYTIDNTTAVGATVTLTGTLTPTSGTLLFAATAATQSAITLTGGTALAFAANEGVVHVMDIAGATIATPITGTNGLTVAGQGQLTLAGTNSALTGLVTVNGSLAFNSDLALGAAAAGTTLSLFGGTLKFNAAALTTAATRTVTLTNFGAFDTSAQSGTIGGQVTGTGGLVKLGANTLTLSGTTNNFTGPTTIYAGTLSRNAGGAGATSSGEIANYGIVDFNQAADATYTGAITGSGAFTKTGAGNLTLTGTNLFTGGTTISAGTLTGTSNSLQGTITNNTAMVYDQTFTGTSGAVIGGAGTLTKNNTGTVILPNASTYTGATNINAGALRITNAASLGSTAAGTTIASGAALELAGDVSVGAEAITAAGSGVSNGGAIRSVSGTNTLTGSIGFGATASTIGADLGSTLVVSGSISGSAQMTKVGLGTLKLTGNLAGFTSSAAVSAGTLVVNGTSNLTGGAIVNSGGILGGTGTVGATTINAGGTLEAGDAGVGKFNTGNLTFAGGALSLDINGTGAAGTAFDQVSTTGSVTLSSNVNLVLTLGFDPSDAGTDVFTVLLNDGADAMLGAGRFVYSGTVLNEGTLFYATSGGINQTFQASYGGGDFTLTAVPEPGTLGTLLAGVTTLLGLQRFRRRR